MKMFYRFAALAVVFSIAGLASASHPIAPGGLILYDPFLTAAEGATEADGSALTPGLWTLQTKPGGIHQGNSAGAPSSPLYDGHVWFFNADPGTTWAVSTQDNFRQTAGTAPDPNQFVGTVAGYRVVKEAIDNGHHQGLIGWRTDGTTANNLFRGLNLTFSPTSPTDMQLTITRNMTATDFMSPETVSLPGVIDADGPDFIIQDVWSSHFGFPSWHLEIYANGSLTPVLIHKLSDDLSPEYGFGNKIGISGSNLGQGFGTFDAVYMDGRIPEPSGIAVLGLAGLAALVRRRRVV